MSEFVKYVEEVLGHFGPVRTRRMFGGYGVYHNDLMIALIADDVLYLKADAASSGLFEARGLARFEYQKRGKRVRLSYFMAPDDIFDEPEEARKWAALAYAAALRN